MEPSKFTRLCELPQRTENGVKIYLREDETASDGSRHIVFHHLDGAYSYCKTEKGNLIHLSAVTPLIAFEDGFQFYNDLMPNE